MEISPDSADVLRSASPESAADTSEPEQPAPPPRLVRSRRRRYLELHPSYYETASADVELAEPLIYDRLVRRHQSAAEREAAGRSRGLADALTGSLLRGEAQTLIAARRATARGITDAAGGDVDQISEGEVNWAVEGEAVCPAPDGEGKEHREEQRVMRAADRRQEAAREWRKMLEERFVDGKDEGFEYASIDSDEGLDQGWGMVTMEEKWFSDEREDGDTTPGQLEGQTGVQDF